MITTVWRIEKIVVEAKARLELLPTLPSGPSDRRSSDGWVVCLNKLTSVLSVTIYSHFVVPMNSPPPVKSLEGHPISSGSPTSPEILVQHIGKYGKDVFWVAFVISVLATLLMGVLAVRRAKGHRLFHFLFILVAVVASVGSG